MNTEPIKEVLNELFSHLERLETQSDAILQFLKEKKRVTDKQLAPYLEQAGNASNVRWRAARVRIEHLLSSMEDKEEETKLGKKPEIVEAEADKQNDRKAAATEDKQAPPERWQQPSPKGIEQSKDEQHSAHPTEMTEELAQREGAEPPPELSPESKSGENRPEEKKSGKKEAA
jgi:hypothetical protein